MNSVDQLNEVVTGKRVAVSFENYVSVYQFDGKEYSLMIKENFFDEGVDPDEAVSAAIKLFSRKDTSFIVYGKKNLMHVAKNYSLTIDAHTDDLLLIKYLTDFSGKEESLFDVMDFYGYDKNFPAYAIADLFDRFYNKADDKEKAIYNEMELPLAEVLFDTEEEGFKVDKDNLEKFLK